MLIIPTSLDTAIVLELPQSLLLSAASYTALMLGAFALWEMVLCSLLGQRPRASRWWWLGAAAALLVFGAVDFASGFGPVTFNAAEGPVVSTAWGYVLSDWSLHAFVVCSIVLSVLRGIDASHAGRNAGMPYIAWWLLGVLAMVGLGLLFAWQAELPGGSALDSVVLGAVVALAVAGLGSLIAVAVLRGRRARAA